MTLTFSKRNSSAVFYEKKEEAMYPSLKRLMATVVVAGLIGPGVTLAIDEPAKIETVAAKAFKHQGLQFETRDLEVSSLGRAAGEVKNSLSALGAAEASARIESLSGRFSTLLPAVPLVPGTGVGNDLIWNQLSPSREAKEQAAMEAFLGYLGSHRAALGIDPAELAGEKRIVSHGDGALYQIWLERTFDGIPVRDSYIAATINHGNLILMTTHQWGDRPAKNVSRQIPVDQARAAISSHLGALNGDFSEKATRVYLTTASPNGYVYRLAFSLKGHVEGDGGLWEALVDAHSGEMLSFQDTYHYAEAKGGVLPVTNDGINPDGVEQAGWPMPFMNVTGGTTDTGGNAAVSGSLTATLSGSYVTMTDSCGAISLTQTDNLNFGTNTGTNCSTPGIGGAGNTRASRTGFYELNKFKEAARGQLPGNTWLTQQLTAQMNLNTTTCNAFWAGTNVQFYRSSSTCANTGEIAGVFDHEAGHGIDDNDVNGIISSPTGEGIADVYAALRINDSCIGRGFTANVCNNNGDACLTCTGVRDIDYLKRVSGNPHTYTWANSTCGGSGYCLSAVYAEAVWSLYKRKLTAAPFNMDTNTALEVATRLTYIGAGNTGTWFSGGPPNGGCAGGSGYLNYLAADDDNGNINDGTPHMTAIYAAFGDQQIACNTPTVQNSGCAGAPTTAPNVTATGGTNSVALSWGAVSGASKYAVYRTEGVFACDFGKVKIGETTGTSFTSNNLQGGRAYSYVVIPVGASDTCMGPASACDTASPTGGGGPTPVTVTLYSVAAQDGRISESSETSGVGGTINSTNNTTASLRVGDFSDDTQYRSIVSFDTSSIPDTATVTSATLRIKRGTLSGTSPFTTHGTCTVDMSSAFGGSTSFAAGDFSAAASASGVTSMSHATTNGTFSTGSLNATGRGAINKTGTTQFRFYMTLDDNDDLGTDYMGFYSGEAAAGNRPELVITYTP